MGRKRSPVQLVKRVIKISLHPERQRDLINLIDRASHKGRLIIDALEGRRQIEAPAPADEDGELLTQLEEFLM